MLSRRAFVFAPAVLHGRDARPVMFADADSYERFMGRWSRLVAPALLSFARLPDSGRVLDVGSGTGSLAFAIAQRNPRLAIVGIDPSGEYVAYAKSKNRFRKRAAFYTGDAQKLALKGETFDAAFSLLVFNFIPNPKEALLEVRRVTRPGGTVAAAVWDYGGKMRMLRAFWDAATSIDPSAEKLDEKHMPLCRAGELAELWRQSGLQNVREQPIDVEMKFVSFNDYWRPFLLGQGPAGAYVRRLASSRVGTLRSEIQKRLEWHPEQSGKTLTGRVWACAGRVPQSDEIK